MIPLNMHASLKDHKQQWRMKLLTKAKIVCLFVFVYCFFFVLGLFVCLVVVVFLFFGGFFLW